MSCAITAALECADGSAANVTGQLHDIYRIGESSHSEWIKEDNKIGSIKVFWELSKNDKPGLETERRQGFVWYRVTGNFTSVKLGDVFVLNDSCEGARLVVPGNNEYQGFCFAQARNGAKPPFGARLNTKVKVYRPQLKPSDDGYHEPLGQGQGQALNLADGVFFLDGVDGNAIEIPAGLSAMRPYGDRAIDDVGSMTRKMLYGCYLPPLNGFAIQEGDRIVEANGARYVVLVPHYQGSGAVGYQLTVEREVSNG